MTTTPTLGQLLRTRRICHHSHRPSDAARAIGITRVAWYRWEHGESYPGDQRVQRVAEYLGLPPEEVLRVMDAHPLGGR